MASSQPKAGKKRKAGQPSKAAMAKGGRKSPKRTKSQPK
jgi:hypothetical protein